MDTTPGSSNSLLSCRLGLDSLQEQTFSYAKQHYESHICSHEGCQIPDAVSIAESFARIKEDDKMRNVRAMLYALTTPVGSDNGLLLSRPFKKSRGETVSDVHRATCYAIRGHRMCASAFVAITQIGMTTLQHHGLAVYYFSKCVRYGMNRKNSRIQTSIVVGFLNRFADLNIYIFCPRSRNETDPETFLRILPSETTNFQVFQEYELEWHHLVDSDVGMHGYIQDLPEESLRYSGFWKVWDSKFPFLKFAKKGSDFCDTFSILRNYIKFVDDATAKLELKNALIIHREKARQEFEYYTKCKPAAQ